MYYQLISLVGATLILSAYVALIRGWLSSTHRAYALLNLAGSLLLLWVAVVDRRMGFILLESLWAVVSIPPLLRRRQPVSHA